MGQIWPHLTGATANILPKAAERFETEGRRPVTERRLGPVEIESNTGWISAEPPPLGTHRRRAGLRWGRPPPGALLPTSRPSRSTPAATQLPPGVLRQQAGVIPVKRRPDGRPGRRTRRTRRLETCQSRRDILETCQARQDILEKCQSRQDILETCQSRRDIPERPPVTPVWQQRGWWLLAAVADCLVTEERWMQVVDEEMLGDIQTKKKKHTVLPWSTSTVIRVVKCDFIFKLICT